MTNSSEQQLQQRLDSLQAHLERENPLMVEVVKRFRDLDKVGYKLGLIDKDDSYANSISWWPLISILGTFSAGKSSFINWYLENSIQMTGNQAVDDKFTVMCYSANKEPRILPGISLDSDPRFPFYQIGEEIDKVAAGEGGKVDSYLQLKTCNSDKLRGSIMIDSPGFDADEQRNATLRITNHIINLSDLVLVFFDARHPEPGAMRDTLEHLVKGTLERNDANKVLFILNQIDTTAREDNLEDVIAAWQRAIMQTGLSSSRFYCIYNSEVALDIEDEAQRQRYESKRDHDLGEILARMNQVSVERVYRIVGTLEHQANYIEHTAIPELQALKDRWFNRVMLGDAILIGGGLVAGLAAAFFNGYLDGVSLVSAETGELALSNMMIGAVLAFVVVAGLIHFGLRNLFAKFMLRGLKKAGKEDIARAFAKNTRYFRTMFKRKPMGWGGLGGTRRRLDYIRVEADRLVQALNDKFTDPAGVLEKDRVSSEVKAADTVTQSAE